MNFLIADVIQFVSGTMIAFWQGNAAKIKSKQFPEFGFWVIGYLPVKIKLYSLHLFRLVTCDHKRHLFRSDTAEFAVFIWKYTFMSFCAKLISEMKTKLMPSFLLYFVSLSSLKLTQSLCFIFFHFFDSVGYPYVALHRLKTIFEKLASTRDY